MEASLILESQKNKPLADAVETVLVVPPASIAPAPAPRVTTGAAPDAQSVEKSKQAAAMGMYKEGIGFLHGVGTPQDFAMASARLLDAADLNHPPALFFCALLYFAGVGVSRNSQTAADYASRYLETTPDGQFEQVAKEVIDGTLGTENARKLLVTRPNTSKLVAAPVTKPKNNKHMHVAAAVMIPILLGGGLFAFSKLHDVSSLGPADISNIKLDSLLSKDDITSAQKAALAAAATMQSDAQSLKQKQDADKAAQAKAEQEQKEAEEAQALAKEKAEHEKKEAAEAQALAKEKAEQGQKDAQAKAEQDARAAQAARAALPAKNNAQTSQMMATAMQAARSGEFDRANGILDAVLAGDSSNQDALRLKESIKRARSRAVNNMQIQ